MCVFREKNKLLQLNIDQLTKEKMLEDNQKKQKCLNSFMFKLEKGVTASATDILNQHLTSWNHQRGLKKTSISSFVNQTS